jgi:hypothetical protein
VYVRLCLRNHISISCPRALYQGYVLDCVILGINAADILDRNHYLLITIHFFP